MPRPEGSRIPPYWRGGGGRSGRGRGERVPGDQLIAGGGERTNTETQPGIIINTEYRIQNTTTSQYNNTIQGRMEESVIDHLYRDLGPSNHDDSDLVNT